jgi:two-component system nitrogen regulation sensor histidine kinase GlnL
VIPPDPQRQLASLSLAVLTLQPGRQIAAANPAAEQMLGQSFRRLRGKPIETVLQFAEPQLEARLLDPEAQVSARAARVSLNGGVERRFDVTIAPIVDQAGWQVLTLHDLARAEALGEPIGDTEQASVLRGPEILAHEIKNPLAGIRGAAQLLGRKLDEGDRALTTLIADEVDRIAKLIDQMQTLSRRSPSKLESCNLHEAVRRARAVLEAAGNPTEIVEEFDPSLPDVLGNRDALVQVVMNLIVNAAEACGNVENPAIAIRTRFASGLQLQTSRDGRPVRLPIELRVSDNGPGVPPAMREHVFEPFVTTKKNGQGLGLALVRRLVHDMNGRIGHDRDEIAGRTHFRVHLAVASETAANIPDAAA